MPSKKVMNWEKYLVPEIVKFVGDLKWILVEFFQHDTTSQGTINHFEIHGLKKKYLIDIQKSMIEIVQIPRIYIKSCTPEVFVPDAASYHEKYDQLSNIKAIMSVWLPMNIMQIRYAEISSRKLKVTLEDITRFSNKKNNNNNTTSWLELPDDMFNLKISDFACDSLRIGVKHRCSKCANANKKENSKMKWQDLQFGDIIDCSDNHSKWCESVILYIEDRPDHERFGSMAVHYTNWASKWDEWIDAKDNLRWAVHGTKCTPSYVSYG